MTKKLDYDLLLIFGLIVMLGVFAFGGWQWANSLSQELAGRDATIANLTASLDRAENKPPEIQYFPIIELPVIVDRIVEKTVYLDRIIEKEIYKATTDFQNLAELRQFVDPIGIIIVWDGGCYDAALFYWQRAYDQGKRVYLDSVTPAEYNSYFTKRVQRADEGHIVVSAVIGRQLYWLDPASAEIILRGELLRD